MSTALAVDSHNAVSGVSSIVDCSVENYISSFVDSSDVHAYGESENKGSAIEEEKKCSTSLAEKKCISAENNLHQNLSEVLTVLEDSISTTGINNLISSTVSESEVADLATSKTSCKFSTSININNSIISAESRSLAADLATCATNCSTLRIVDTVASDIIILTTNCSTASVLDAVATDLAISTTNCGSTSTSSAGITNMSVSESSICGSPERKNSRKNPKPIKNRGSERLSENCEPLSGSENKLTPCAEKKRPSKATPLSTNLSETGRGKRIRKPTRYAKFLESDMEDEVREVVKRVNQNQESDKGTKSVLRRNNTIKPAVTASKNSKLSESESLKLSLEETAVNGAQSKNVTSFKNILTKSDDHFLKSSDHLANGHVTATSSLFRTPTKSVSPCSSRSAKSNVSPTQSRRSKRLENQEGKCMQLSVTNEDGEIEDVMVTIVDIDSSSDDEQIKEEENLDCAKLEQYLDRARLKQSPKVEETDCKNSELNATLNGHDDSIVLSDEENSVLNASDIKPVSDNKTSLDKRSLDKSSLDKSEKSANRKRLAPKSSRTSQANSSRRSTSSAQKRKRKSAFDDDDDYNCNSKVAERLSKRYGCKTAKRLIKSTGGRGKTKTEAESNGVDNGPYIRVEGPKSNPTSCKLKNSSKETDSQSCDKKILPNESFSFPSNKKFLASAPWVCVFCGHGSTYRNLGDLFGPYYPTKQQNSSENLLSNSASGSHGTPTPKSATSSPSTDSVIKKRKSRANEASCGNEAMDELPEELWLHMECCVWSGGMYVAGGRLRGLEDAASIARKTTCCHCLSPGATIGCYMKGCQLTYHYLCALDAGCTLNDENFTLFCSKHKEKRKWLKSGAAAL